MLPKKRKKKKMSGYPCFFKSYRFSKIRKIAFLTYFYFIFHGIDLKYVNEMCFKKMYPQATCQITKLKDKNENTHSRAKMHFFFFFFFFLHNCLVHLREYTQNDTKNWFLKREMIIKEDNV